MSNRFCDNCLGFDEALEKTFRDEVARRLGMKKGNIKIAIVKAIKMWIGERYR